ncbi:hypothetical protein HN51_028017 [Arachis hypogaea]|uniref:Uncharacterized protein n=2 Tax=Arachis TaxID=3817 RepID=A0A445BKJ0_ARAHY|nr:uncharacterized protein LOC107465396 [Arachis duranensis]XP_029144836.1 uncharacterized protein LOC112710829 [Arachis hypogaea]XP_057735761.1 uncharacterized protein LOC130951151 [Arachis stenosperma]QHO34470.1 uncharacterized protein DS421_9g267230 [Arachis hypogaea]RYR39184.1 hypothetical protein Ahy_A09g044658 [Arachis hypogaea]
MKKKKIEPYQEEQQHQHHKQEQEELEILKAVAQAWYSHSGSSKPMSEFDARRRNFKVKPSRFKLEAMRDTGSSSSSSSSSPCYWNFQQSLWDSYELCDSVKRIEMGLDLDNNPFGYLCGSIRSQQNRKPESKNNLRNLFSHFSSRRFNATKNDENVN